MNQPKQVRIKKISPYPFAVTLLKAEGAPPQVGQIVKIVEVGFLAKVNSPVWKVGDNWIARFELPASKVHFNLIVKVMKTYDSHEKFEKDNSVKSYLVEMQFLQIDEEKRSAIVQFCAAIGQTSK